MSQKMPQAQIHAVFSCSSQMPTYPSSHAHRNCIYAGLVLIVGAILLGHMTFDACPATREGRILRLPGDPRCSLNEVSNVEVPHLDLRLPSAKAQEAFLLCTLPPHQALFRPEVLAAMPAS